MFGLNLWTRPFLHPAAAGTGQQGLEASSYLPNPLASPALMVLASTAESGRAEAGQLPQGHPLAAPHAGGAGRSDKDAGAILNPFAAGTASAFPFLRPGAPHLAGLHPPLWRPQLDPTTLGLLSARGAGAFHPLSKEQHEAYPSAFMPAAKRLKLAEDSRAGSPGDGDTGSGVGGDGRTSSPYCHPGAGVGGLERHPSPAGSRHDSAHSDVNSEPGDRYTPDSSVKDLSKWVSPDGQGLCCPICQTLLQAGEVQSHLAKELSELNIMLKEQVKGEGSAMKKSSDNAVIDLSASRDVSSKSRYETFLRIKGNREARLAKVRGRRRRYNEMAQQMIQTSSATSPSSMSGLLDSSTEKEACDDEQIDVISCDEHKENAGNVESSASKGDTAGSKRDAAISCSVCMEPYTSCCPITSMLCWHVHCEKCWLKAMETKKLCPQCNVVTSPSDLRRIFI